MKTDLFFSVIIPSREPSYYLLFETLPAFEQIDYHKFEVIILPNQSAQYDLTLLKKYRWLRIIPTGKITRPAEKRNIGANEAKGDILAFIDDDAYPKNDWLKKSSSLFFAKVVAVCGPGILPANTSMWEKSFDEVLKTWIGSGGYGYRFTPQKKRYVDDYPSMNFLVKKPIYLELGGFKENYWPGEDSKLCEEIVYKKNKCILYHPNVIVYHHRRKNLKSYLKQHANYGFHRGAFFAHGDKNSRRISYLIPTFFVFYLVFIVFYAVFFIHFSFFLFPILYLPLLIYFFFTVQLFFSALFNTKNLLIAVLSPVILFTTHLVYGIMFVKGFRKGLTNKKNIYG